MVARPSAAMKVSGSVRMNPVISNELAPFETPKMNSPMPIMASAKEKMAACFMVTKPTLIPGMPRSTRKENLGTLAPS
jgi:hypothetical protein